MKVNININKKQENGNLVLALGGRLDTATAPKLEAILEIVLKQEKQFYLDFENLAYVSSAGLRVLLWGAKTSKIGGGTMFLKNVSSDILEVLDMTGFSDILTIV